MEADFKVLQMKSRAWFIVNYVALGATIGAVFSALGPVFEDEPAVWRIVMGIGVIGALVGLAVALIRMRSGALGFPTRNGPPRVDDSIHGWKIVGEHPAHIQAVRSLTVVRGRERGHMRLVDRNNRAMTRAMVELYTRELVALVRVGSPYVPRVRDAGSIACHDFVVSEHIDGDTYRNAPTVSRDLDERNLSDLSATLFAALTSVHRVDVIHRDVNPSNIIATPNCCSVLVDFGLAYPVEALEVTFAGTLGTMPYIAPEVARGAKHSKPSDVFSAAASVYFLANREAPFSDEQLSAGALIPPHRGSVSDRIFKRIEPCLQLEPSERPDAEEVLNNLLKDRVHQGLPDLPIPSSRNDEPKPGSLSVPVVTWLWVGTVLVAALLAGLAAERWASGSGSNGDTIVLSNLEQTDPTLRLPIVTSDDRPEETRTFDFDSKKETLSTLSSESAETSGVPNASSEVDLSSVIRVVADSPSVKMGVVRDDSGTGVCVFGLLRAGTLSGGTHGIVEVPNGTSSQKLQTLEPGPPNERRLDKPNGTNWVWYCPSDGFPAGQGRTFAYVATDGSQSVAQTLFVSSDAISGLAPFDQLKSATDQWSVSALALDPADW